MIKKAMIAALALAMGWGAARAQTAVKLTAAKANDYGIAYSLPKTLVDVVVEIEFVEQTPGEFSNFAKRSLNIQNAITRPMRTATVKSVTFVPRGVADPDSRWLIQLRSGVSMYAMLNEGMPLTINTEDVPQLKAPSLPVAVAAKPTPLETEAARQAMTQDMILSTSVTKRAQLAAERIFELREYRSDLISGQADNMPPDGQSLRLALDNLTAQEDALTAMFAGTEKRWTKVQTVTYEPTDSDAQVMLCRISPTEGIVAADDLSGAPLMLTMKVLSRGEAPLDDRDQPLPMPKNAVAYCIPGDALFTVSYGGREAGSATISLSELGITYGLDPKMFSEKKTSAKVVFDPNTGAITILDVKEQ